MGGGSWDSRLYSDSSSLRASRGIKNFAFHDTTSSKPREEWKSNENLDPKKIKLSPFGVRESRDSTEHPDSVPVIFAMDVTGSMSTIPGIYQSNLDKLMSFLIRKGGLEQPQVAIVGVGDATCDRVPLQVSQFESDNRIDEHLRNLFLEGGGGGQSTESYELAMYFASRLTILDCLEKRGRKGYLIFSGDESPYPMVKGKEVKQVFDIFEGNGSPIADIPLKTICDEVKEKFFTYYIMPAGTSHYRERAIVSIWQELLGQNVLFLDDPSTICAEVASIISMNEGAPDLGAVLAALNADSNTTRVVETSLANYSPSKETRVSRKKASIPATTKTDNLKRL